MLEYLKMLTANILNNGSVEDEGLVPSHEVADASIEALVSEIQALDTRLFAPSARYDFAFYRKLLQRLQSGTAHYHLGNYGSLIEVACTKLLNCFDQYLGYVEESRLRAFTFIQDVGLRRIIERDYMELEMSLLPDGAWKSTVVMAGSILEAVLFDALNKDPATQMQAMGSSVAPKVKSGAIKLFDDWTLQNLIDVAADINVIPRQRADAIDQTLRDYRNFVHPKKEIRTGYPCTEAEAYLAKGALDSVLNHLSP